ncbi:MAG: hypothetical protein H8E30_14810, partial [Alphaproteobacteria bacterium]|nr:hypothetical protein [Alphaproteobacteria bacterium]
TTRWTTELRETFQDHPGHYEFLHSLASAAPTSDGKLLFVSAGIDPGLPLEKQNDAFWWNAKGFEVMAAPFEAFNFVIRGFDAAHKGFHGGPHTINIDAADNFAGPLQATCFAPDGSVLASLPA